MKIPVTVVWSKRHIEAEVWSTSASHGVFTDHPELVVALREAVQEVLQKFLCTEEAKR